MKVKINFTGSHYSKLRSECPVLTRTYAGSFNYPFNGYYAFIYLAVRFNNPRKCEIISRLF